LGYRRKEEKRPEPVYQPQQCALPSLPPRFEWEKRVCSLLAIFVVGTASRGFIPALTGLLQEVNQQRLDEIEHFFVPYNNKEGRQFKLLARHGATPPR
jgi:hypothetical protein